MTSVSTQQFFASSRSTCMATKKNNKKNSVNQNFLLDCVRTITT
ncbi:hypothetical protein [Rickettsia asembonensis]|nr:hypothetical protein [Rickettsia asembonensis]